MKIIFFYLLLKIIKIPRQLQEKTLNVILNHFKYIKRLLKRYKNTGQLKTHLLLNHFIILYNIFGEATTPMLFFKIEDDLWSSMKSFIIFLNKLPEFPKTYIHDIQVDIYCLSELYKIYNGKEEVLKN